MPLALSIYLIITAIAIVFAVVKEWRAYHRIWDSIGFSIMFVVFFGIIWFIVMGAIRSEMIRVSYESSYEEIVFIKTNISQELHGGGCFLGWSIDSEGTERYHVTKKTPRGYKKEEFNASDIYIKESDDISPRIEYKTKVRSITDSKWFWDWTARENPKVETIIVPKGTIIQEINKL